METNHSAQQPRPVVEDKSLIDELADLTKKLDGVSSYFLKIIFKVGLGLSLLVFLYKWLFPSEGTQVQGVPNQQQTVNNIPAPNETTKPAEAYIRNKRYPSVSTPKVVIVRDTIKELVEKPTQPQKTQEDIIIIKSRNGLTVPFKATRKNDTIQLEQIESVSPTNDSLTSRKESKIEATEADITMVGRYESKTKPKRFVRSSDPKVMTRHFVRPGDILSKVAQIYGVSKSALMKANNRKKDHATRGEWLNIPYPENYFVEK